MQSLSLREATCAASMMHARACAVAMTENFKVAPAERGRVDVDDVGDDDDDAV